MQSILKLTGTNNLVCLLVFVLSSSIHPLAVFDPVHFSQLNNKSIEQFKDIDLIIQKQLPKKSCLTDDNWPGSYQSYNTINNQTKISYLNSLPLEILILSNNKIAQFQEQHEQLERYDTAFYLDDLRLYPVLYGFLNKNPLGKTSENICMDRPIDGSRSIMNYMRSNAQIMSSYYGYASQVEYTGVRPFCRLDEYDGELLVLLHQNRNPKETIQQQFNYEKEKLDEIRKLGHWYFFSKIFLGWSAFCLSTYFNLSHDLKLSCLGFSWVWTIWNIKNFIRAEKIYKKTNSQLNFANKT